MKLRQVVDGRAATYAGLLAGTGFLIGQLFVLPRFEGGNLWVRLRYLASPLFGDSILAPPATYDARALVFGIGLSLAVSFGSALLLALIIHRWGLPVGILGGFLFGSGLYFINFYSLTIWFPWLWALHGTPQWILHVIFGASAGGLYELFEVESFEMIDSTGGS